MLVLFEPRLTMLQLDDRYFRGLVGHYTFQLQFRLHKDGEAEYIAQNNPTYFMERSTTAELELEAGRYCVMVKISATRNKCAKTPADVVKESCETRRDKLMAVGLSYDLAHAKGGLKESELQHKQRVKDERRDKRKTKAKRDFEAERASAKRSKLKRLPEEAKSKAKEQAKEQAKGDARTDAVSTKPNKIVESIESAKSEETGVVTDAGRTWSRYLSSKEIKSNRGQ